MADEVIDADGDLTVVCGGVSFQVFTQPIACASPVFRAMLLSDFAEGVAVRKSEPSKPAVVELPEDDPEAFHIFCDLAHHKLDHLPRDLEVDSMDKLAIFADKYQCALLMKTKGRSWIVRTLHYYDYEPEELWLLLHFAYVLDSQDCFSRIARMLVEDSKKSFVRWRYARDNMRTFPDELLAQLDLFYYKVKEQMQMALMDPVLELSKHVCQECRCDISDYLWTLWRSGGRDVEGMIPATLGFSECSIKVIIQEIVKAQGSMLDDPIKGCGHHFQPVSWGDGAGLLVAVKRGIETYKLCLRCLKKGCCEEHLED